MDGKSRSHKKDQKKKLAEIKKSIDANGAPINCGKSTNTMHNTDLLEDLVGMIEMEDEDDEVMQDIISSFKFGEDLYSPQYNSNKGKNLRNSYHHMNGSTQVRKSRGQNGWKDFTRNSH